jgi:quercetin dioxygenase-like cupin family protein
LSSKVSDARAPRFIEIHLHNDSGAPTADRKQLEVFMECTEIYADADGHSSFRTIRAFDVSEVLFNGKTLSLSPPQPCESMLVHEFDADYYLDRHNPPSKQYVVVLEGELEIAVRGGELAQRFPEGSVFVAGDLQGSGHSTRAIRSGRALVVNIRG